MDLVLSHLTGSDGEADWAIPGAPLVASVLGLYGRFDADLQRGYGTAGSGVSRGKTNVDAYSARGRLDWRNAFSLGSVQFSPAIAYTLTRTRADAYQETGGLAPAAFAGHSHTASEIRASLFGDYTLSEATTLDVNAEYVHRLDSNGGAIVVANVLGVSNISNSFAGSKTRQDWVRLGTDLQHRFDNRNVVTLSGHVATAGQDADYSAAISYRFAF
jgi:hypothetical protein